MEDTPEVSQDACSKVTCVWYTTVLGLFFGVCANYISAVANHPLSIFVEWVCDLRIDHIAWGSAERLHPLTLSCYLDEDAVGKVKKLAMASHPNKLGRQVLERYACYICVRWLRRLTQ